LPLLRIERVVVHTAIVETAVWWGANLVP